MTIIDRESPEHKIAKRMLDYLSAQFAGLDDIETQLEEKRSSLRGLDIEAKRVMNKRGLTDEEFLIAKSLNWDQIEEDEFLQGSIRRLRKASRV